MSYKSLIIGMGIGQLYKSVLSQLGHTVITVDSDPNKGADLTSVDSAIAQHAPFDTVHICTPNYTHAAIAKVIAPYAKIVFIEKPGVSTSTVWSNLVLKNPSTRFMMVKNNMWRENIAELREFASRAVAVNIDWINKDRVPNPGTWFTTKELAFGGVSRDLMPHLLSLFMSLCPEYTNAEETDSQVKRNWELSELTQTDYGTVKADGTYDVDDYCKFAFSHNNCKWQLVANWRSLEADKRNIEFHMSDGSVEIFELGLCPEDAYSTMISDAVENVDNIDFWTTQLAQDIWIHQKVETKCA